MEVGGDVRVDRCLTPKSCILTVLPALFPAQINADNYILCRETSILYVFRFIGIKLFIISHTILNHYSRVNHIFLSLNFVFCVFIFLSPQMFISLIFPKSCPLFLQIISIAFFYLIGFVFILISLFFLLSLDLLCYFPNSWVEFLAHYFSIVFLFNMTFKMTKFSSAHWFSCVTHVLLNVIEIFWLFYNFFPIFLPFMKKHSIFRWPYDLPAKDNILLPLLQLEWSYSGNRERPGLSRHLFQDFL